MPRKHTSPPVTWSLDTEDDSNGNVTIIDFCHRHEHVTFHGAPPDELRRQAWAWLYREQMKAPMQVWACNTEYDLINLYGPWVGKMTTLVYVGSGLMRATSVDMAVVYYDTYRHWSLSVEEMGKRLGFPKMPRDFQSVEYCRRDAEIVWRFVTSMIREYEALGLRLKPTLPGMALQLYTLRFSKRPLPTIAEWMRQWYRRGYYGGRVEVYRFREIKGPIYHYDVNSLYPSVMVEGRYPDLWVPERLSEDLEGFEGWQHREGMADVTVSVPKQPYPPLPVRSEEGEIVYPWGRFRGAWAYPELRILLESGGTIEKVHMALDYDRLPAGDPFADYIHYCYDRRQKATDQLGNLQWKLFMNSLYGKFGQREGLEVIFNDKLFKVPGSSGGQSNVLWAAYVTSLARAKLWRLLNEAGAVYYTDTDSLFTPVPMRTSAKLGDLKLEGTYSVAEFFGNKLYIVDGKAKAKGVPRDRPDDGVTTATDFIRTGRAIFRRPARLRESRRSLAVPNVWYEVSKERDNAYTKRLRQPDGRTRPWLWDRYVAVMEA